VTAETDCVDKFGNGTGNSTGTFLCKVGTNAIVTARQHINHPVPEQGKFCTSLGIFFVAFTLNIPCFDGHFRHALST
jgi:hypothetical protein